MTGTARQHFLQANRALVAEVAELENRARRRDLLIDDETVFAFYDQRIPESVVSGRHFDAWWKKARRRDPQLLDLSVSQLLRPGVDDVSVEQFPDRWTVGDFTAELSYRFEPGTAGDGVTVEIALPLLNDAVAAGLDWQVPGLRVELITALLRTLPKQVRRAVVPIPQTAAALAAALPAEPAGSTEQLTDVLSAELGRRGVLVPADAWQLDRLPEHLRPTYQILDPTGAVLGQGKDLARVAQAVRARGDGHPAERDRRPGPGPAGRLGLRRAAPDGPARAERQRPHRLSGAGRRGRHGRRSGVRQPGGPAPIALGGHPPAARQHPAVAE